MDKDKLIEELLDIAEKENELLCDIVEYKKVREDIDDISDDYWIRVHNIRVNWEKYKVEKIILSDGE